MYAHSNSAPYGLQILAMFELPEEEGDVEEEDEDSSLALLDWACEPELAAPADGPETDIGCCGCCSCCGGCGCSET